MGYGRPQIPEGKALLVGRVVEGNSKEAIQYANISVLSTSGKVITGGITDEEGKFKIEIPYGTYYAIIDFMGFAKKKTDLFKANEQNRFVKIGMLQLSASANQIGEVEIKAERKLLETKIDRKTFNLSKDISMKSKNALEALEEIPSISVDMDGNISLRGNKNVRILINDRPIVVTAENQAAILEQIQADNIESIDVITNPSAKYNPEGMGGIINIQLKKSQPAGKNFAITTTSDFYQQHSVNLSAGLRTKKINLYGTYGFRDMNSQFERVFKQKMLYGDSSFYRNSNALGERGRTSHMGTISDDYKWNKHNSIGAEALASFANRNHTMPFYYYNLYEIGDTMSSSQRKSIDLSQRLKVDGQLRYKHTFAKKKHYVEATAFYTQNVSDANANYFETSLYPEIGDTLDLSRNTKDQKNKTYHYKVNYQYPISDKTVLEAGLDGELRDVYDDINIENYSLTKKEYENNIFQSSQFQYYDQVHAVYGLYRSSFSKWTYQLGLRLEYSNYYFSIKDRTTQDLKERFNYYPTLHVRYKLNEKSDWTFSYSKRVNRPWVGALNPIRNYTDAYHYRVGNPNLAPENIHATELAYSKRWNKLRLLPAVFYKYVDQVINRVKTRDSSGMDVVSFQNLDSRSSLGAELIVNYTPLKWIDVNASANANYSKIIGSETQQFSNEGFGWSAKLMTFFKLPYQMKFQFSYHYNGERIIPQGYILPMQWMNLALKKMFFKRKLVLGLRVSDVFRTRAFNIHVNTDQYDSDMHFRRIPPYFVFSLTYQVGKMQKRRPNRSYERGGEGMDL